MSKKISNRKSKRRTRPLLDRTPRDRLLYRRIEVSEMLGLSMSTIVRMEQAGTLTGVKLGPNKRSPTLYRAADVHRLAGAEVASP